MKRDWTVGYAFESDKNNTVTVNYHIGAKSTSAHHAYTYTST